MAKLIIDNRTGGLVSDYEAIRYVAQVVDKGLISNNNTEYCSITQWRDGTTILVYYNKQSIRFLVTMTGGTW